MASPRRVGAETSKTRDRLLDSVERLMVKDGYAAVTYRAVAAKAGVTSGLVQYYFPALDDLFVAAIRRRSEQNLGPARSRAARPARATAQGALGVQPGRIDRGARPPSSSRSETTASRSALRSQSSPIGYESCSWTRSGAPA